MNRKLAEGNVEKLKQQFIGKYVHKTCQPIDPTFPPKQETSQVGRATRITGKEGRKPGGEREDRKAMSAFMGRWLSQGGAGQGAQSEPDPRREGRSRMTARTQESGETGRGEIKEGGREGGEKGVSDTDRRKEK